MPNTAPEDISAELRRAHCLGRASRWNVSLYTFDGVECPRLMRRVCQLREESYGAVGVTGEEMCGVERADVEGCYRQLIVWDSVECDIVGGYRYATCRDVNVENLSFGRYFTLSGRFCRDYLPYALELGRSFVSPKYQVRTATHTIHALDALWEGLARVVQECEASYLVGRVTLYPTLGVRARNLLVGFLHHVFPPCDALVSAREPLRVGISRRRFRKLFVGDTPRENYRILLSRMRSMRRAVPPILSSYMRLSPSMQSFDAYLNHDLGGVAEVAIMLTVADIYDDVKRRYFF